MVKREEIKIDSPKAGPYSHAIRANSFIFTSGQVSDENFVDIKEQTLSVLNKIKKILSSAGAKVSNIAKLTVYLKDINDFKEMNQAYLEFFMENNIKEKFPARSTIEAKLIKENVLIEIDAIAIL
jgi:2-iminobutanoate/2-iminopropanoate deaminase